MAWSELKYALNSTIGTPEFESLDEIVKTYSPIKHIQHGMVNFNSESDKIDKTVTLTGFTDESKMIAIINGKITYEVYQSGSGGHVFVDAILTVKKISTTQLVISSSGEVGTRNTIYGSSGLASYQVIEFM